MGAVCSLVVGCSFTLASASKLAAREDFSRVLRELAPQSFARPSTFAVPIAELVVAVPLLTGIGARGGALAALVALVLFTAALRRLQRTAPGLSCVCFGSHQAHSNSAVGFTRNAGLMLCASIVVATDPSPMTGGADLLLARITLVVGVLCTWSCIAALASYRGLDWRRQ